MSKNAGSHKFQERARLVFLCFSWFTTAISAAAVTHKSITRVSTQSLPSLSPLPRLRFTQSNSPFAFDFSKRSLPTIGFTPFAAFACEQSMNPHSGSTATSFNLTEEVCVTSLYSFGSYFVAGTAQMAESNCTLTLYSGDSCVDAVETRVVEGYYTCDIPRYWAKSVVFACGL